MECLDEDQSADRQGYQECVVFVVASDPTVASFFNHVLVIIDQQCRRRCKEKNKIVLDPNPTLRTLEKIRGLQQIGIQIDLRTIRERHAIISFDENKERRMRHFLAVIHLRRQRIVVTCEDERGAYYYPPCYSITKYNGINDVASCARRERRQRKKRSLFSRRL